MSYDMSSLAGPTTNNDMIATQMQPTLTYTPEEEERLYVLLEAYPEHLDFIYLLTANRRLSALIHCMIQDLNATPAIHIDL
eukprot:375441-Ditylum_brightwellii.AAC.1